MFPLNSANVDKPDYLIVGLGNPGERYENTRQNIGFKVVDFLRNNSSVNKTHRKKKHWSVMNKSLLDGHIVLYAKPLLFMDNAGMSVSDILNDYRIKPSRLIVIHDEIGLKTGHFKVEKGDDSCTHRGIKSIIEHIGTSDFLRIKIGVGEPPTDIANSSYLLSAFSEDEYECINKKLPLLREYFTYLFFYGLDEANRVLEKLSD